MKRDAQASTVDKAKLAQIAKQYPVGPLLFTPKNNWDQEDVKGLLKWVCMWFDAGVVTFEEMETKDRQLLVRIEKSEERVRQALTKLKKATPTTLHLTQAIDNLQMTLADYHAMKEYGTQLLDDIASDNQAGLGRPPSTGINTLVNTLSEILLAASVPSRKSRADRIALLLQHHTSSVKTSGSIEQYLINSEK